MRVPSHIQKPLLKIKLVSLYVNAILPLEGGYKPTKGGEYLLLDHEGVNVPIKELRDLF